MPQAKKKKVPQFKGRIREGSMLDILGTGGAKKAGEAKVKQASRTESALELARKGLGVKKRK